MAFGSFGSTSRPTPMAEINIVPLVDVMMVLLVIFIVTAPLLSHSVVIDLPKARSAPITEEPQVVTLSMDNQGLLFWNGERLAESELEPRLQGAAQQQPQPELRLRADQATPYQHLATVMSAAARAGLRRVGFVTDPSTR